MRRVLLWSSAALLMLVLVAAIALSLIDLSRYRATIEAQASKALGRSVTIGGELEIKTSLTPTIAATEVLVSNIPDGSRDEMARVGRLELGLELLPLFSRTVRLSHIAVVDADIVLETGADGIGNWVFATGRGEAEPDVDPGTPGRGTDVPFIERVELRETTVSYKGIGGRLRRLDIEAAMLETASDQDEIDIRIDYVIDGHRVEIVGTAGSLADFRAGDADWPVQLAISMDDGRISAVGAIADPTTFSGYRFEIDAEFDSLGAVADLTGQPLPDLPALAIAGTVAGDVSEVRISGLSASLGDSQIGGDLEMSFAGARPAVTGNLVARHLDLADLSVAGSDTVSDTESDLAIPVAALGAADVDLRLSVDKLTHADLVISDIQGSARILDRRLQLGVHQARLFEGMLAADFVLDGRPNPAAAAIDLSVSEADVGEALQVLQVTDTVTGRAGAELTLTATGAMVQAMVATMDGRIEMEMGPGTVTSRRSGLIGRSALTALLPSGDTDTVTLHCAVGQFDVSGGVATSTAMLIDSRRVTIAGEGAIDFGNGTLDMVFNPRAKDASLLALVAPARVHGPLDAPEVTVMTGDLVVRSATGVLLGVINPFAIVVPFVTGGSRDENPCLTAVEGQSGAGTPSTASRLLGGAADAAGEAASDVGEAAAGVGRALGDAGRGIRDAFGGLFGGGDDPAPATDP